MDNLASQAALPRREQRKRDRRERIVAAAREAFLRDGYAAMSMSRLLKTLGGSKMTLWSYFRSKEELFVAVIENVTGAFRAEIEIGLSELRGGEATLTAFCRKFTTKIGSDEALAIWRLVVAESERFPEAGQIFHARTVNHAKTALTTYLESQIASGYLIDEDPGQMAEILIAMCSTHHNKLLWGVPVDAQHDVAGFADTNISHFIRLFGASFVA